MSLAAVFSTMHTHSSDMGITDWGIGQVGGLCVWGPVHVCAVAQTWLSTCNVSPVTGDTGRCLSSHRWQNLRDGQC